MNIVIYTDSGHGWAAVKLAELEYLGITHKISGYSYISGDTAFLEEDCDLSVYLHALKALGKEYTFIEKHTNGDSAIRGFKSFQVTA